MNAFPMKAFGVCPDVRRRRLVLSLGVLREATEDAGGLGYDPWEFSVPFAELLAAGVVGTDLRWMVACGFVEHGREMSHPLARVRSFRHPLGLNFTDRSRFVLTEVGREILDIWLTGANHKGGAIPLAASEGGGETLPRWD